MYNTFEYQHFVRELSHWTSFQHWLCWWVYLSDTYSSAQPVCFLTSCGSCGLPLCFLALSGPQRFTHSLAPMHETISIRSHQPSTNPARSLCAVTLSVSHRHTFCFYSSHMSLYLTVLWAGGAQGLVLKDKAAYFMFFFFHHSNYNINTSDMWISAANP